MAFFTETIDGKEVKFQVLGSMMLVDATKEIRRIRQEAFSKAGSAICGSNNPEALIGQTVVAIDQYMSQQIPDKNDLRSWLSSFEGAQFMIAKSARKADPKINTEELFDVMDLDQIEEIGGKLFAGIFKKPSDDAPPEPEGDSKSVPKPE